ncbi:Tunicamycin resistance protein [Calothrix sp. NIES-4071]|nr:Tunicamycin resistance protein [Calothrix sp. NIES-4071]BAZ63933.1 Tunicamycin resistance protein [Calothrix sp. NIES-4105]
MIVLLNGSFGVGKTTVARILRAYLEGSAIYNPEWVGSVLMRVPKWIKLKRTGENDFQHIKLWRKSTITGIRVYRWITPGTVIVPMTFTHRDYFDEVVTGIKSFDSELKIFCLKASLNTIKIRLQQRGTQIEGAGSEWIARRIIECSNAYIDDYFGEPIDTEYCSAQDVAADIASRLN